MKEAFSHKGDFGNKPLSHEEPRIIVYEEEEIVAALNNANRGGRSLYLRKIIEPDAPLRFAGEIERGHSLGCLIDRSVERLEQFKHVHGVSDRVQLPEDQTEVPHLTHRRELFGN